MNFNIFHFVKYLWGKLFADTNIVDSATVDTAMVDTAMVDTATVDTATVDTATVDTATVDTATVDTVTVDTATVDTVTVDTATVDTVTVDTATVDTATVDTTIVDNNFNLIVEQKVLDNCIAKCNNYFSHQPKVEVGGLMIGTFDGITMNVYEFLFDVNAQCSPSNITLSADIFRRAEEKIDKFRQNSSKNCYMIGTWHTHPDGYCNYSSTDKDSLFRDSMRIITDDPSRAFSPMVHFIFNNFKDKCANFRVFMMRFRSEYDIEEVHEELGNLIKKKINEDKKTIGLFVSDPDSDELSIENYHPDFFNMDLCNKIKIHGFWRYYPFEKITSDFEKVFLENFFQKIKHETFSYARLLQDENEINIEWYKCVRSNKDFDAHSVINFEKITVQIDKTEQINGNNPEKDRTTIITEDINNVKEYRICVNDTSSFDIIKLLGCFENLRKELHSLGLPNDEFRIVCGEYTKITKEIATKEPNMQTIKSLYISGFKIIKNVDGVGKKFIGMETTKKISKLLELNLSLD